MVRTVEEIVAEHMKSSERLRRKHRRDPEAAKSFLIRAGIAEQSKAAPNGIRLAKRFR